MTITEATWKDVEFEPDFESVYCRRRYNKVSIGAGLLQDQIRKV